MSKGALYLEWPGKEPLFDALLNFEMARLLADLRERVEGDPQGGLVAHLYGHTLLALKANPLISACTRATAACWAISSTARTPRRYTDRLMLGKEVIAQMQAAGLLRADLRPEVMTALFSIIALGFAGLGSVSARGGSPAPGRYRGRADGAWSREDWGPGAGIERKGRRRW